MKYSSHTPGTDVRTLVERQCRGWDRLSALLKQTEKRAREAPDGYRPVITVSGSTGSGRGRLALALCEALEYELVGRELLDEVASDLNCQRALLETLDEKVQSNISLMLASVLRGREIENQDYVASLFRVIGSLAEKGGLVILGRGGAVILGNKTGLRIRVEAPLPVRIRRIMEVRNLNEREARLYVETHDSEQREFWRHCFHREENDPLLFDLTLNSERIDPEEAVSIVQAALARRAPQTTQGR